MGLDSRKFGHRSCSGRLAFVVAAVRSCSSFGTEITAVVEAIGSQSCSRKVEKNQTARNRTLMTAAVAD